MPCPLASWEHAKTFNKYAAQTVYVYVCMYICLIVVIFTIDKFGDLIFSVASIGLSE